MSNISKSVSTLEETRTGLCDEFVSITGSDSARALNSFFEADMEAVFAVEDSPKDSSPPKVKRQKLDKPQGKVDCNAKSTDSSKSVEPKAKLKASGSEEQDDSKLSLISWNVDGLDTVNLGERARGLCSYLALYTPDVVFLQELIEPYVQYLKKRAVKFRDQELCVMTSHFESCKGQAEERMKQLRVVLKRMTDVPSNVTVLFGGDTNLRDTEVTKVGGLPSGVCDVWDQLGKQEHCRYTWDTKANSNKSVPYVSRCRFDRVYLRPAREGPGSRMAPDHMALVGLEKLDCGRYTSDHWGIYCSFTTGS
ncbi:unnamed protein product [Coregonus sp. 'balchen']|nr:unnamed protein product [Coregonus sp. 'balchen']